MIRFVGRSTACLLLLASAFPGPTLAKGGFFPKYVPKPCEGDTCQANDPKSGQACEGLLCTFSSAKAMQAPVTAAQAAEARRAAAAAEPVPSSGPPSPVTTSRRTKRVAKVVAKIKGTPDKSARVHDAVGANAAAASADTASK